MKQTVDLVCSEDNMERNESLESYIRRRLACTEPCHCCSHWDFVATDPFYQCRHPNKCKIVCKYNPLSGSENAWYAMDLIDCRDCRNFNLQD